MGINIGNRELIKKIEKLKKEKNAIILVHNYQRGEVQDIADYRGDSLGLSRIASKTDADVILFCGVRFMAETASILSPHKTVLIPDDKAGCPMADMITREQLIALKKKHPKALVVGYVNSSAEVKAELDVCCTSANAVAVIEHFKDSEEIIFVPDKYLGSYASRVTGKELILWNGYCPTHMKILPENIKEAKEKHPKAEVLIHPECSKEALAVSDQILSTGGMTKYVKQSKNDEFIIATEIGMIYSLETDFPDKKFYPATEKAVCPNMKLTSLENVLWSLEDMKYEVKVPEEVRIKAKKAVDRMIEIG